MSESLSLEYKDKNVHVTALCPGFTYSEFHDVAGNRAEVSKFPKALWMEGDVVAREAYDAVMAGRSEEHTSELQSLMRISYAVFCLKKKKTQYKIDNHER